jgi:hypothetical protein
MRTILRRCSLGLLSGAAASAFVARTLSHGVWNPILGVAVGAVYSASLPPARKEYVDHLMAGASLGFPLWGLISVIAMPLISGQRPEWNAEEMRQHLPALVAWVVFGASLAIITQALKNVYEKYHKYVHMLYWNCLGHWGLRDKEFPDLKEITKFSVLVQKSGQP